MAAADESHQARIWSHQERVHLAGRQDSQLAGLSDAVRRLLSGTRSVAEPMISKAGLRGEARRARTILRAAMKEQQLKEVNEDSTHRRQEERNGI
jgi:hypothetical protein